MGAVGTRSTLIVFVSLIDILKTDNVVFSKIATRLHLNELKRDFTGIGKAVHRSNWNINRLVFVNVFTFFTARDFGRPADNDPMLGAVKMLLQGQDPAGLYDDALDLKSLTKIDRLIMAPGPVNAAVIGRFGLTLELQMCNDVLYLLRPVTWQHQHGIPRADDYHILRPKNGCEAPV